MQVRNPTAKWSRTTSWKLTYLKRNKARDFLDNDRMKIKLAIKDPEAIIRKSVSPPFSPDNI
jgi:hypothetical protein